MALLVAAVSEDIEQQLSFTKKLIDDELIRYLELTLDQCQGVLDASVYTIINGGHRWRPFLLLTVGRSYGASIDRLLPMACVVELLHTAAMILDDLPCMDDARTRHARNTCHLVFGEDTTILASHFLLTTCFEIVRTNYSPSYTGELTSLISDMIKGQAGDLKLRDRLADRKELEQVYNLKSGRLAAFSARMGALLGRASESDINHVNQFGQVLGLAYQILDDLFDAFGGLPDVGKEPGKDQNKTTFVDLFGREGSGKWICEYKESALSRLEFLSCDTDQLRMLADYVVPSPHFYESRNG
jgi:geranylgeranyl diphosphate synthase, type II